MAAAAKFKEDGKVGDLFFCFHVDLDHLLSCVEGIVCGSCLSRCTWYYGRLQNCLVPLQSHCQSDEHWNRFRGDIGETFERWGGAHMGFSEHIDAILN